MAKILGISAYYHDSAAALMVDGTLVAAAQEERFTRKKHEPDFPRHATEYCLKEAKLQPEDLDYVVITRAFSKGFDRTRATYWDEARKTVDLKRYYRQF